MSVPGKPVISLAPRSSNQTLEFRWGAPTSDGGSPIIGYRLQLNSETPISIDAAARYYKVTGLTNGTNYIGALEAENAIGFSEKAYFRVFQPGNGVPAAPSTATAVTDGTDAAVVSWTPPSVTPDSTILWYYIRSYSNNGGDPVIKRTGNGLTQSSLYIKGLNPNSAYTFEVKAVNCPGYSPPTNTNSIVWFQPGQAKWATRMGGASTQSTSSVTVDDSGNVYILSTYDGTTTTLYNYSSAPIGGGAVGTSVYGTISGGNFILVKYNTSGAVQWATVLPSGYFDGFSDLNTDTAGNVYVTINLLNNRGENPSTFRSFSSAPVSGGAVGLTSYGTLTRASVFTTFVVKYNTSGIVQWVTKADGGIRYSNMAVNRSTGDVYITPTIGSSASSISLYSFSSPPGTAGGAINVTLYGTISQVSANRDSALVRINTSGVVQWAATITNTGTNDASSYTAVTVDSQNNPIVGTNFTTNTTITIRAFTSAPVSQGAVGITNWGTLTQTSAASHALIKYNSSGTPLWATYTQASGTATGIRYISCDANNNVYLFGLSTFGGSGTFRSYSSGGGGGGAISTTSFGTLQLVAGGTENTSPFIVKYNSSGVVQWVTNAADVSYISNKSMCDSAGNFYLVVHSASRYRLNNYSTVTAGNIILTLLGYVPNTGGGSNDIFIVKYNSSGSVVWCTNIIGTLSESDVALYPDSAGNVYVTGIYQSNPATIRNFSALPVAQGDATLTTFGTLADVNTGAGNNIFLVKYAA